MLNLEPRRHQLLHHLVRGRAAKHAAAPPASGHHGPARARGGEASERRERLADVAKGLRVREVALRIEAGSFDECY